MQNITNISLCIFQTDLIVLNEIIGVMGVDALASSHPLSSKEEDVLTPDDIGELFDSITYSKVWYNWGQHITTSSPECIVNEWIKMFTFPRVTLIKDSWHSLGATELKS